MNWSNITGELDGENQLAMLSNVSKYCLNSVMFAEGFFITWRGKAGSGGGGGRGRH